MPLNRLGLGRPADPLAAEREVRRRVDVAGELGLGRPGRGPQLAAESRAGRVDQADRDLAVDDLRRRHELGDPLPGLAQRAAAGDRDVVGGEPARDLEAVEHAVDQQHRAAAGGELGARPVDRGGDRGGPAAGTGVRLAVRRGDHDRVAGAELGRIAHAAGAGPHRPGVGARFLPVTSANSAAAPNPRPDGISSSRTVPSVNRWRSGTARWPAPAASSKASVIAVRSAGRGRCGRRDRRTTESTRRGGGGRRTRWALPVRWTPSRHVTGAFGAVRERRTTAHGAIHGPIWP